MLLLLRTSLLLTFQFHKGAIRTELLDLLEGNRANFNSIKVRLELMMESCLPPARLFQFHKGAIRTEKSAKGGGIAAISIP